MIAKMDGSVGIAAVGLVLLLLLRPWRLEDQADRDYSALAAYNGKLSPMSSIPKAPHGTPVLAAITRGTAHFVTTITR
jgi:hypothetical protein